MMMMIIIIIISIIIIIVIINISTQMKRGFAAVGDVLSVFWTLFFLVTSPHLPGPV